MALRTREGGTASAAYVSYGSATSYLPEGSGEPFSLLTEAWTDNPALAASAYVLGSGTPTSVVALGGHAVIRQSGVTGSTNAYVPLNMRSSATQAGDTVYFRAAIVPGDYSGQYFDGHTVGALRRGHHYWYTWEGEPDNSVSIAHRLPVVTACGLYFGNEEHLLWAPAPDIDVDMSPAGWGESGTFLNGGAYVRRSQNAAQVYRMNWTMFKDEDLAKVFDFYHGRYGEGPFYMLVPGSYDNVLPRAWSMPRLQTKDAPPFARDEARPTEASVGVYYGRPAVGAHYEFTEATSPRRAVTIPLPPGYFLHVGVHGEFDPGVRLHVNDTPVEPLALDSPALTNTIVSAPGLHTFSVRGVGQATITALTARLTQTPVLPTGDFVPGKGMSAVDFEPGSVGKTMFSAAKNWYHGSANIVEVGQWLSE